MPDMKYFADAKEAKQIDALSLEDYNISSEILMERAACAAAEFIKKHISINQKILAVSGNGNNGGDASAVARILHEDGYNVALYMPYYEKMSESARIQYDIAMKSGVNCVFALRPDYFDVIIDGLFGIGLNRDVKDTDYIIINQINNSGAKVFAIDIPSGINASTGAVMGIAINAYATVTFGVMKAGLLLSPGNEHAGIVHVAKAAFPGKALDRICRRNFYYEREDLCLLPKRYDDANKGTYGKLLVIAGSYGMSGAAELCAKAAYHSGCGLVRIFTDENNRVVLQKNVPEAVISCYNTGEGLCRQDIMDMLDWADVVAIGPGMGKSEISAELLDIVINNIKVPVVIDADAINLLAEKKDYRKIIRNSVITPHLKEMSRLSGKKIKDMQKDMVEFAKQNSSESIILVLKNSMTVVSNGERVYVNTSGNDGMATAGSGDVLTGIIASFMAQGLDRYTAASVGVYVHGLAGDAACECIGHYALTATDIINSLGEVLV